MMSFLWVCLLPGNVFAQEQKVALDFVDAKVSDVFDEINRQTGLGFVYNRTQLQEINPVTLQVKNVTVDAAMSRLLEGTSFEHYFEMGSIVVRRREQPAQQVEERKVAGVVKDEAGNLLPGVAIILKGTTVGTATDVDGKYILTLPEGKHTLVFSMLGMKVREEVVGNRTEINVVMQEDVAEMEEVIVTGYQNIKKENATGSYQVIDAEDLERRYSTDVISSLEGMLPGLVSYNTGLNDDPESNIMIRGVSTFTDRTKPLVVVDGLPIEGSIETVNPYDIESITVLKDAAAASIYGARASNGVIVVTTKKAKADKVEVSVSADVTVSAKQKYDNYGWANAAQQIEIDELTYAGTIKDELMASYLPMYQQYYPQFISPIFTMLMQRDAGTISEEDYNAAIEKLKQNNYVEEWRDAVLRCQVLQQYNVALRSKGRLLSSNVNLNFKHTNEGIVRERDYTWNISYRGDLEAAKWLDIAFGFNMNVSRAKKHADELGRLLSPSAWSAYHTIYNEDGSKAYYMADVSLDDPVFDNTALGLKTMEYNLLDELDRNFTTTRNSNLRSYIHATFKIMDGLNLAAQFQYEDINNKSEKYLEKDSYDMRYIYNLYTSGGRHLCPDGGILDISNTTGDHYTFRLQGNYSQLFKEKHAVEAAAGVEIRETNTRTLSNRLLGYDEETQTSSMSQTNLSDAYMLSSSDLGTSFSNPWYTYNLVSGWGTSDVKHRYTSVYVTANYTYDGRYSLSGSWRVDKTDLFGADPKYRGRPLWSVGASWNAHNEDFMQSADWLNYLKVRFSYGLTGNIDQSVSSYLTARIYNNSILDDTKSAAINNPPNDQLRWEKTASYNLGVDYGFFDNRLSGSLDFYYKYSTDLLSETDLDATSGWTSLTINNGEALNQGIELAVNGTILKPKTRKGLGINANLNFAVNKNEIKKITTEITSGISVLGWGSSTHVLREGNPINSIYAFRFAGFEKDNNDYWQLAWYRADGTTSTTGIYSQLNPEDAVFAGGMDPKFTGSFTPEITWNGLSLTAMFAYYGGHYMRANASAWQPNVSFMGAGNSSTYASALDFLRNPEAGIYFPQGVANSYMNIEGQGLPFIDQCVYPADFLKLRNIVLSYELPEEWCRKCRMTSARLRFQMNNVATWVKNDLGIDPEANNAWTGSTLNETPKSYTISLSVNF